MVRNLSYFVRLAIGRFYRTIYGLRMFYWISRPCYEIHLSFSGNNITLRFIYYQIFNTKCTYAIFKDQSAKINDIFNFSLSSLWFSFYKVYIFYRFQCLIDTYQDMFPTNCWRVIELKFDFSYFSIAMLYSYLTFSSGMKETSPLLLESL